MSYIYDDTAKFWKRPSHEAFNYSDGDATEADILARLLSVRDRSVLSDELRLKIHNWPTLYHFSSSRANLLRPHEQLLKKSSVLELGGGCGAVTRYLGETSRQVTMVEGSLRRAGIAAARCEGLNNVSIYCDNILNLDLPKASFDVVTLIGVLEYARMFDIGNADPVQALLEQAKSFLKPEGILVLAIENQLGLKYYAGDPEDHVSQSMFGINDLYHTGGVVTFGALELKKRLQNAGFMGLRQYLPLPDYKLPTAIIHPEAQSLTPEEFNLGAFLSENVKTDFRCNLSYHFSIEKNWDVIARNGLAWDMCNSLYFVAQIGDSKQRESMSTGDTLADDTVIASHYGLDRKACFAKQTHFIKRGDKILVQRSPLLANKQATQSLLQNHYKEEEDYFAYKKYIDELYTIVNTKNWTLEQVAQWNRPLLDYWDKQSVVRNGKKKIPSTFMDCIASNVLVKSSGELILIDQEWSLGNQYIPLNFVVCYNLLRSFSNLHDMAPPIAGTSDNIWEIALTVMDNLGVAFSQEEQGAFSLWLKNFYTEALGIQSAGWAKGRTLPLRYTLEELATYANQQINNLLKEKEILQSALDKYSK